MYVRTYMRMHMYTYVTLYVLGSTASVVFCLSIPHFEATTAPPLLLHACLLLIFHKALHLVDGGTLHGLEHLALVSQCQQQGTEVDYHVSQTNQEGTQQLHRTRSEAELRQM